MFENLPCPDKLDKKDIVELLQKEEYGFLPFDDFKVSAEILDENSTFCAGKAILKKIKLTSRSSKGEFSFPLSYSCLADNSKKKPLFILINFRPDVPDKYLPSEELADNGYDVMSFCYSDITTDDENFDNGVAKLFCPDGRRSPHTCGKIRMWAWALMRVIDYAVTLDFIDKERIFVVGHSRLGKTALLAGALDDRIRCAFSNNSGCSGAALSRNKKGETVAKICELFPYWFCENYKKYADKEETLPFDQHFLIAANYPHNVYVASAEGDLWADPENEYTSCLAASSYYTSRGKTGLVSYKETAQIGDRFDDGNIGYYKRAGLHYLSREDWLSFIKYANKL